MNVNRCPFYSVTTPQGTTTTDWRPGHTVVGLMFYLDPFQRQKLYSLRATAFVVVAYGGGK